MQLTKNCWLGPKITDLRQLKDLSDAKRSVAFRAWPNVWQVRPAAFMIQWPLSKLIDLEMHHTVNMKDLL